MCLNPYTGIVRWENGDEEQIDVSASSDREAERLVREELDRLYKPGGRIVQVLARAGHGYFL